MAATLSSLTVKPYQAPNMPTNVAVVSTTKTIPKQNLSPSVAAAKRDGIPRARMAGLSRNLLCTNGREMCGIIGRKGLSEVGV
jgi:hypothetical protein